MNLIKAIKSSWLWGKNKLENFISKLVDWILK